jgi:capsid protein
MMKGVLRPVRGGKKGVGRRLASLAAGVALVLAVISPAQGADRTTRVIDMLSSGTYTAATAYSSPYDVSASIEGQILINVTAESGTSTLDITVQVSDDNSTWYTHTAIAQITATGQTRQAITNFGKYIRIKYIVGGTSFTFEVAGVFKN